MLGTMVGNYSSYRPGAHTLEVSPVNCCTRECFRKEHLCPEPTHGEPAAGLLGGPKRELPLRQRTTAELRCPDKLSRGKTEKEEDNIKMVKGKKQGHYTLSQGTFQRQVFHVEKPQMPALTSNCYLTKPQGKLIFY